MPNIRKYTIEEQVERYYSGEQKLTEKELEIVQRWELAFSLLRKHRIKRVVVKKLIAIIEAGGGTLSPAQAYRDISQAEQVFTPIQKTSKDFQRLMLIESAIKDLEAIKKRMNSKDKDGCINMSDKQFNDLMLLKNKVEWRLIELSGISDDIADLPDFSLIQPNTYSIQIDESTLGMLRSVLSKGAVDASELLSELTKKAEDIDHYEASNEED